MKRSFPAFLLLLSLALPFSSQAAVYTIDTPGMHAFVQFRIQHLGYSWLYGRFNKFEGQFTFDEKKPELATVRVTVDVASLDTNHAERDKHLRATKYLNVGEFPKAEFISTQSRLDAAGNGEVEGNLTLHGVTLPVTLQVEGVGAGADPWGGQRRGFEARATIRPADFGMSYDLGPASETVELMLSVEGIRKK